MINELLGETDIYLIDQIMKGRYKLNDKILDAGCGTGRNLQWFLENNISIFGTDQNADAIEQLRLKYPLLPPERFQTARIEKIPFENEYFDHIICSAVLHFAESIVQFQLMMKEMVRILKPGGSLFIRLTSDIGIEDKVQLIGQGVYIIPDGSKRFLLTRALLKTIHKKFPLFFIEPLKTVNVDDQRCMSTLVFAKKINEKV